MDAHTPEADVIKANLRPSRNPGIELEIVRSMSMFTDKHMPYAEKGVIAIKVK